MKSFAVILAAAVAAAQGQVVLPAGYAHAGLPAGYAGLPAGYAGLPAGYAHAGLPLGYNGLAPGFAAHAAPAVYNAAPIAAPAHIIPAAPKTYAVPPARIINEAPVVETVAEKVEQHGYKIKY